VDLLNAHLTDGTLDENLQFVDPNSSIKKECDRLEMAEVPWIEKMNRAETTMRDDIRDSLRVSDPLRIDLVTNNLPHTPEGDAVAARAIDGASMVGKIVSASVFADNGGKLYPIDVVNLPSHGRAFCHDGGGAENTSIHLSPEDDRYVAAHEIGHAIEFRNAEIMDYDGAYLYSRIGPSETAQSLNDLYHDGRSFRPNEVALADHFMEPYMGKLYPGSKTTEIMSCGIEQLLRNPKNFAEKDPAMFVYIVDRIRGTHSGGVHHFSVAR